MPIGNPNYSYDQVYAIEQKLSGSFYDIVSKSHIIVAILALGGYLNKGFMPMPAPKGTKAVVPLMMKEGVVEGVTRANMYQPQAGIGQTDEDTFEFAEYPFATLRGGFQLDYRQETFLNGVRGLDMRDAEIKRLKAGFTRRLETQILGAQNGAEDSMTGLLYEFPNTTVAGEHTPSASTNKPGNLDYASNPDWRPQAFNWNAALTLPMLTRMLLDSRRDAITVEDGFQQANLLLLAETTTVTTGTRLYSKAVDAFVNVQRLIQNPKLLSLGYTDHVEYMGAVLAPLKGDVDGAAAMDGLVFAINTSTMFFGGGIDDVDGSLAPLMLEPVRPPRTQVMDYTFVLPAVNGLMDPGRNVKYYGVS